MVWIVFILLMIPVEMTLVISAQGQAPASLIVIDASIPPAPPHALPFPAGGRSATGHTLSANDRYLMLDGKPWFPVMGEFHYSRYPDGLWEKELLKIKAAGVQVVSTYVFWIHHEEVEGEFTWDGQRNLRHFLELCAKHGLYVWLRIGPWDHGEVRNGGLPDWVLAKGPTRENNPGYLTYVRRFYGEIAKQTQGQFWKDGGPIIGVQLENEYSARGPGKGTEHILELHRMARDVGLDAPFYTITGWDNAAVPPHDVFPVFGGYADGFWWRSLTELPPTPNYFFTNIRCEENVGDDLNSKHPEIDALNSHYPFLTAEMGGGMEVAYHRRPRLSADDTAAMAVVKLGSGVVGYGYYMFHGGTNPDGVRTTLQESQVTGYPNDVPVESYDFQAPLGEFGQEHPSYPVLKTLNLFLGDFGTDLAPMTSYFPTRIPESNQDVTTPRVAARIFQDRGFLFINNHERAHELPEHKDFQVQVKLPADVLRLPDAPITIPRDAYTIWPLKLDLGPLVLRYATAQLLCTLDRPRTYVFFAWPGIAPEFAFEDRDGVSIEALTGQLTREDNTTYIKAVSPGSQIAVRVKPGDGSSVNILVLSREQALNLWKSTIRGKERLVLSSSELYFDESRMHVVADDPSLLKVGFFPGLERVPDGFTADKEDGVFQTYSVHLESVPLKGEINQIQEIGGDPAIRMGKEVAMAPEDSAFASAARWKIEVPQAVCNTACTIFLQIDYEGDVARLNVNGKLLTDNFYNGTPWLVALDRERFHQGDKLDLQILPLREHAPLYLPKGAWPSIPPGGEVARLKSLQVFAQHEYVVGVEP